MVFSGPSLRAARRRTRTPARALAQAAGRTERSVFAYETGQAQPSIAVASRLATELGLDLADLLVDDSTPKRGC